MLLLSCNYVNPVGKEGGTVPTMSELLPSSAYLRVGESEEDLTEVSVVLVRTEEFLGSVEEEAEGQEDLDVWPLLEDSLVHGTGVLQLVDAHGVDAVGVADGVQRVQDLVTDKTKRKLPLIN